MLAMVKFRSTSCWINGRVRARIRAMVPKATCRVQALSAKAIGPTSLGVALGPKPSKTETGSKNDGKHRDEIASSIRIRLSICRLQMGCADEKAAGGSCAFGKLAD